MKTFLVVPILTVGPVGLELVMNEDGQLAEVTKTKEVINELKIECMGCMFPHITLVNWKSHAYMQRRKSSRCFERSCSLLARI